jgi:hypothetical protein
MELGVALLVAEVVFESEFAAVVSPPDDASSEQARAKHPDSTRPPTTEMSFCDDMRILHRSMVAEGNAMRPTASYASMKAHSPQSAERVGNDAHLLLDR